jgi:hypothetical protein
MSWGRLSEPVSTSLSLHLLLLFWWSWWWERNGKGQGDSGSIRVYLIPLPLPNPSFNGNDGRRWRENVVGWFIRFILFDWKEKEIEVVFMFVYLLSLSFAFDPPLFGGREGVRKARELGTGTVGHTPSFGCSLSIYLYLSQIMDHRFWRECFCCCCL